MMRIIEMGDERGADYCEIRIGKKSGTSLELKDGELKRAVYGVEEGAGIRVLVNGAWGFCATTSLDQNSLMDSMKKAIKLARGSSQRRKEKTVLADAELGKGEVLWKPKVDTADVPIEEKFELVQEMYKRAVAVKDVHTVTTGYGDGVETMRFINSEGADLYSEVPRTFARAVITAREGGKIAGFVISVGGTGGFEVFERDDPVERVVEGAESAARILHAERSPSGRLPLIADHHLTGVFAHEAVGHATEADHVVSGASCLEGLIGERVGSDIVTIVDDPTQKGSFGSFPFDSEGVVAKRKVLVDHGILKDYILDRETAHKLGMVPNGGARAQSFADRPLVRMSNTFIESGDWSFEEMVEDIKLGVYAKGSRGGQVDPSRGTFQFAAQEAFLIENGEVTKPLRDVAFSGLTLEILKSIDAVGNDFKPGKPGTCGKGQFVSVSDGGPHIRIKGALIGGGKE